MLIKVVNVIKSDISVSNNETNRSKENTSTVMLITTCEKIRLTSQKMNRRHFNKNHLICNERKMSNAQQHKITLIEKICIIHPKVENTN